MTRAHFAIGKIEVSRTGPFSPPIFLTRPAIIVTKSFRKSLKASGLTGLSFKPAVKKHVVAIAWEKWDQTAREPKFYPAGGEPDGYLRRKHDQRAADAMEDLFEVGLKSGAALKETGKQNRLCTRPFGKVYSIDLATYGGFDFFRRSEETSWPVWFVTERAKHWLEQNAAKWVGFENIGTIGR